MAFKNNEEMTAYWEKYGSDNLKGKTVAMVRYLSQKEAEAMGWYKRPIVIQFTDGTIVFPSMDDEGNDGGALFGQTKKGDELTFPVL
jgi:hypothetical protein